MTGNESELSKLGEDLLSVINGELALDPTVPVEFETDLLLTGQLDSLGVIQLVDWIETNVGISVPPTDVVLENFQTVKQMVDYLASRGYGQNLDSDTEHG